MAELLAKRSAGLGGLGSGDQVIFGSWLALATIFVGATGIFVELRSAVQAMAGEHDGAFSWWGLVRVRLLAIGVVLGCGFLLSVAMLAQTAALVALRWVAGDWGLLAPLLVAVETLWSLLVIGLLFAAMIRWLPTRRIPRRAAIVGGVAASALFMVGRYGISLYVATTATQSALGAAGSFAALLVWVYWSSQISSCSLPRSRSKWPSANAPCPDRAAAPQRSWKRPAAAGHSSIVRGARLSGQSRPAGCAGP